MMKEQRSLNESENQLGQLATRNSCTQNQSSTGIETKSTLGAESPTEAYVPLEPEPPILQACEFGSKVDRKEEGSGPELAIELPISQSPEDQEEKLTPDSERQGWTTSKDTLVVGSEETAVINITNYDQSKDAPKAGDRATWSSVNPAEQSKATDESRTNSKNTSSPTERFICTRKGRSATYATSFRKRLVTRSKSLKPGTVTSKHRLCANAIKNVGHVIDPPRVAVRAGCDFPHSYQGSRTENAKESKSRRIHTGVFRRSTTTDARKPHSNLFWRPREWKKRCPTHFQIQFDSVSDGQIQPQTSDDQCGQSRDFGNQRYLLQEDRQETDTRFRPVDQKGRSQPSKMSNLGAKSRCFDKKPAPPFTCNKPNRVDITAVPSQSGMCPKSADCCTGSVQTRPVSADSCKKPENTSRFQNNCDRYVEDCKRPGNNGARPVDLCGRQIDTCTRPVNSCRKSMTNDNTGKAFPKDFCRQLIKADCAKRPLDPEKTSGKNEKKSTGSWFRPSSEEERQKQPNINQTFQVDLHRRKFGYRQPIICRSNQQQKHPLYQLHQQQQLLLQQRERQNMPPVSSKHSCVSRTRARVHDKATQSQTELLRIHVHPTSSFIISIGKTDSTASSFESSGNQFEACNRPHQFKKCKQNDSCGQSDESCLENSCDLSPKKTKKKSMCPKRSILAKKNTNSKGSLCPKKSIVSILCTDSKRSLSPKTSVCSLRSIPSRKLHKPISNSINIKTGSNESRYMCPRKNFENVGATCSEDSQEEMCRNFEKALSSQDKNRKQSSFAGNPTHSVACPPTHSIACPANLNENQCGEKEVELKIKSQKSASSQNFVCGNDLKKIGSRSSMTRMSNIMKNPAILGKQSSVTSANSKKNFQLKVKTCSDSSPNIAAKSEKGSDSKAVPHNQGLTPCDTKKPICGKGTDDKCDKKPSDHSRRDEDTKKCLSKDFFTSLPPTPPDSTTEVTKDSKKMKDLCPIKCPSSQTNVESPNSSACSLRSEPSKRFCSTRRKLAAIINSHDSISARRKSKDCIKPKHNFSISKLIIKNVRCNDKDAKSVRKKCSAQNKQDRCNDNRSRCSADDQKCGKKGSKHDKRKTKEGRDSHNICRCCPSIGKSRSHCHSAQRQDNQSDLCLPTMALAMLDNKKRNLVCGPDKPKTCKIKNAFAGFFSNKSVTDSSSDSLSAVSRSRSRCSTRHLPNSSSSSDSCSNSDANLSKKC